MLHPRKIATVLTIIVALIFSIWFLLSGMSDTAQAQGLGISATDYANGQKRAAAVARKVTPAMKSAFKEKNLAWGSPVFLRAFKEEAVLELWVKAKDDRFVLFKSYPIAAASGKLGPKLREGDRQVPEGFYFVSRKQMNPRSRFHLSFNIGYPNSFDKAHRRTGSFIMIHGSDVSIGCLAMTDPAIEEIYTICDAALANGQAFFRVHIFPFRLTPDRLAATSNHQWHDFWNNLEAGYRWFEEKKSPPNVLVRQKRYVFE